MTKERTLMGRPKTVFTDEQIAQVEALAAYLSISDIAYFLDISPRNFLDIKNRDPRVEEAYKKGKAKAISFVASKLMHIIREEENTPTKLSAIIFYLKTQAGWSTEHKNDNKIKLKFPDNKTPTGILDTALISLEQGEITLTEAQNLANLAMAKLNVTKSNGPNEEIIIERESQEQLMTKIQNLRESIEFAEWQNNKNGTTPQ